MPTAVLTYLALGDSMSIDLYTGQAGGGAVSQFYRMLGPEWRLIDRTNDGEVMPNVPTDISADLITLTIAGFDALTRYEEVIEVGVWPLVREHLGLLQRLRDTNPDSCLIVGNIYRPRVPILPGIDPILADLNAGIVDNVRRIDGCLADIYSAFLGHESDYYSDDIEPSLEGATAIARLFFEAFEKWEFAGENRTKPRRGDRK